MLDAGELHLPDSELKIPANRARWFSLLYSKRWVLYAKRPFGGPQQVLSYLANYTHRVALSNRRIVAVDAQHQSVTFTYRDYRHGSQRKELTLSALEFIRRFSLHILPPGLVRIRHYGILGNNRRKRDIEAARAILMSRGCAVELQPQSVADPALWRNVLSLVRKSRNSSGGLYRCRRRSAHDRRRTNAMRFLMNTLLAHPTPRLMHAFRQNPLWIRSGSHRCLRVLCEAPLSPSEVTGAAQLQLSIFWRQFNPAFQSCWHGNIRIQNPSLPSSAPHRSRYFSQTLEQRQG